MTMLKANVQEFPLQVWERLQLVVGETGSEGIYSCRVKDITPDCLIISRPVFDYGHTLLANNRSVMANFTRADAAYTFSAKICETEPKSADTMFLTRLGEVRRLQRRRFVRIDKDVRVCCLILPRPISDTIDLKSDGFTAIKTVNISAGGMCIPVFEGLEIGSRLLLDMTQSELKRVPPVIVGISRQTRVDDENRNLAGVEFILNEDLHRHFRKGELTLLPKEIAEFGTRMQNDFVAEIFAEQLLLRQKGLL